jgi:RNA polymerase sigma-70 factor (sigma-E family)
LTEVRPGDAEFVEFAGASALRLRRTAFLLCHDWHLAQDLTQTALAKTYVAWKRVWQSGNPEAYTQKILLRAFLDLQRRRSASELIMSEMPETPRQEHNELRLALLAALRRLPPRDRAIVVLRYWEDLSIETTADLLELPVATVKTQSSRSLAKLRTLLQDERVALFADQD